MLRLTRLPAYEWAGRGLTVKAILPNGHHDRTWPEGMGESHKGEAFRALSRPGGSQSPRRSSAFGLFLASGMSDTVSGTDILVDNGFMIQ